MRFLTAGESHGQKLVGIIEGLPSGMKISRDSIDIALRQRQQGPGRGGRMAIEQDEIQIISGVRGGLSTGAPIALEILNRDWENWQKIMAWGEEADLESRKVLTPRPGHADLTGSLKYRTEVRNILERASARETAMRVGIGNLVRQALAALGVEIRGHVLAVGGVHAERSDKEEYWQHVKKSEWSVGDPLAEQKMEDQLLIARNQGESLGGLLEVQVYNIPAGLGSHVHWDRKLDGKLAQAVLSVQAIKGVSFGLGFEAGERMGSLVHDPITYRQGQGFARASNHAGGIEGGMSNGEPIILQAVMKPIPTLYQPLDTVHLETKEVVKASVERSDVCAVPAALVVLEHVVAWVIAEAVLEKFPADNFAELKSSWEAYQENLRMM
ncbi:chorismate synthase [Desulfosporosinus sp. BICA1-9]|uniref:chorismate synthase n=1 Tax=Desulfosporosinus sp. BICA1-9 TaxID=1531958 RepID=UPI00054C104F|nr:chorismate synthase [Desulfosporosinus sp. BICA1-9]KJS49791.1 MAG: chorismate synthase [Peptococcaceae bacterium BRH_c23]KJS78818.1 MAG: chorismate synthase [Desulfosporosinus sp. BICA1-9]HBW36189.1 chorismate synthase [Desulfosporosinus sp.]